MKKKEYNIKDKVWIHLGEPKLVEGRIVEVIDLEHLKEGHSPDRELYIIELKTGIDDIYEVRDFDQISPDATGPINLFRKLNINQVRENSRYLKKVGMKMPVEMPNALTEIVKEINQDQFQEENEPTAITPFGGGTSYANERTSGRCGRKIRGCSVLPGCATARLQSPVSAG